MNYASNNAWGYLLSMQEMFMEQKKKTLQSIIKSYIFPELHYVPGKLHVMDLASGTSFLSLEALSGMQECFQSVNYTGIDCDSNAISMASGLSEKYPAIKSNFFCQSVFAFDEFPLNSVLICMENSFFQMGHLEEISALLNVANKSKCPCLILSCIPWDETREKYHQQYSEWIDLEKSRIRIRIKAETKSRDSKIIQTIHMDGERGMEKLTHIFHSLSKSQIEEFIAGNGFAPIDWINPFTGESEHPESSSIPEFYLIAKRIEQ